MNKGKRGFTLIEMLVAFSVFTVVMTGVYLSFSIGLSVWKREQGQVETYQNGRIVLKRIAKELRCIIAPEHANVFFVEELADEEHKNAKFIGQNERITFFSLRDDSLVEITYCLHKEQEGNELSILERSERKPLEEEKKLIQIASNIQELDFEYFDKDKEKWDDVWASGGSPAKIKVKLLLGDEREAVDFEQVVHIPVYTIFPTTGFASDSEL